MIVWYHANLQGIQKIVKNKIFFLFCRYKVEEAGTVEEKGLFGLSIAFDNIVEQTVSDWQINPVTLLTRIGGRNYWCWKRASMGYTILLFILNLAEL